LPRLCPGVLTLPGVLQLGLARAQAAWEPSRAVDASLLGPPTPPGPPAEVGWLLALAVLCAARLGCGRARADRFRPDLALVRARRS